jgi:hypothetical protein
MGEVKGDLMIFRSNDLPYAFLYKFIFINFIEQRKIISGNAKTLFVGYSFGNEGD